MASAFPDIAPSVRSWTPGVMPQSQFATLSGYQVRTSHSDKLIGGRLNLVFNNLREAVAKQIITHYQAQQSTFELFTLSASVWAGMDSDYMTPVGQQWRYAGAPTMEFVAPGIASVSVSLDSVPV